MKNSNQNASHFSKIIYPRLSHYIDLTEKRTVARYLRCKSIPAHFSKKNNIETLWELHTEIQNKFDEFTAYLILPYGRCHS